MVLAAALLAPLVAEAQQKKLNIAIYAPNAPFASGLAMRTVIRVTAPERCFSSRGVPRATQRRDTRERAVAGARV